MFGETVTRLVPGVKKSAYVHTTAGDSVAGELDWSNPTRVTVTGAAFDPGSTDIRYSDDEARVVQKPRLLFPGQVNLGFTSRDRWIVRGTTFAADGLPEEYVSPFTGYVGGTTVRLRVVQQ